MSFDGRIRRSFLVGGYAHHLSILFVLGNLGLFCATSLAQEDEEFKVSGPATIDKVIAHATLPEVHLAKLEGFDTEPEYLVAKREQSEALAKRAIDEREESVRADFWLACANHILAYEIEPACSRRFHRLDVSDAPVSADVTAALLRTDTALQRAGELLEILRSRDTTDAAWLARFTRNHRTLVAFARGLGEYLVPASGDDRVAKAREAASALAIPMEDSDKVVALTATLWHAALRARAGDPEAALAVLPMTASDAPKSSQPQAYFARLLRCELLAQRGGYGVALALLAKLDEPVAGWFPQGASRDDAMRTLAWTKLRILMAWHVELSKSDTQKEEADWCAERMQAIIADRLPEDRRTISRVSPVIPIMVTPGVAPELPKPEAGE